MDYSSERSKTPKTGEFLLPKSKAQTLLQITENITEMLPNTFPSTDQVFSFLTMHRTSDIADALQRLGHRISYSGTLAVED